MTERQAPYITHPNRETMIGLINSDARMIPLADGVVQCVITSPPYWGLRDYGVDGQIGLERTPEEYVSSIIAVMRECWRVMRDDGTLWLNLGDSYAGGGNYRGSNEDTLSDKQRSNRGAHGMDAIGRKEISVTCRIPKAIGLKPKDLVGIPWRVAFALQADGWYLRSDIIWHKPNPMPESVTDRPTKAHEYIFLLTKQERYYYDAEAISEPSIYQCDDRKSRQDSRNKSMPTIQMNGMRPGSATYPTRNRRSVWTVATSPYSGAHFATFPPALVELMTLAGSRPGDLILDPFAGTATVGRVCIKHGRSFVGLDLNMAYIDLAEHRTSKVQIAMPV